MSDKSITLDFSMGDEQLYYNYKISIARDQDNRITIVDGNCLLRDYGIHFGNLDQYRAESIEIKNFISAGSHWPEEIKKAFIKDCENGGIKNS